MKAKKRNRLFEAWAIADHLDKSTEWMIQYMQDYAKVDHDTVMNFLSCQTDEDRNDWYTKNPNWYLKFEDNKPI